MKIYGPYKGTKGRRQIIIVDDGKKTTVPYARWLIEQDLERRLSPKEYVHHINGDHTDDRLENLEVLSASEHIKIHRPIEMITLTCKCCGQIFERKASKERHNRKQGKDGPFCSKRCVGKTYH